MEKIRKHSPLVPQKGMQPCQDLEFSPVRPMSNFRPTEPEDNKLVLF